MNWAAVTECSRSSTTSPDIFPVEANSLRTSRATETPSGVTPCNYYLVFNWRYDSDSSLFEVKKWVSWQTTSDMKRRQERPACLLWAGLKFQSEKLFVLSGLTVFHQKLLEIWRVINSSYFISWDLRLPAQVQGFLQGWERKDHSLWNCCVLDSPKNHKWLFLVAEWNITLTCFLGLFLILK